MVNHGGPDPGQAQDPGALVALMRELRDQSGLTYRQLEQKSSDQGTILARSTIFTALARETLPRPEMLAAFVAACGKPHEVEAWLAARERIAAAEGGGEAGQASADTDADATEAHTDPLVTAPYEPSREESRDRRWAWATRRRLLVALTALVVVSLGSWMIRGGPGTGPEDGSDAARPSAPASPTATTDKAFSLFEGRTTRGATSASVGYRYWESGDGWYGIEYVMPRSVDDRASYGDGWGGKLRMHYQDRFGSHTNDLTDNPDSEQDTGKDRIRYGMKNVWFEICDSDGRQLRDCQRLRKART